MLKFKKIRTTLERPEIDLRFSELGGPRVKRSGKAYQVLTFWIAPYNWGMNPERGPLLTPNELNTFLNDILRGIPPDFGNNFEAGGNHSGQWGLKLAVWGYQERVNPFQMDSMYFRGIPENLKNKSLLAQYIIRCYPTPEHLSEVLRHYAPFQRVIEHHHEVEGSFYWRLDTRPIAHFISLDDLLGVEYCDPKLEKEVRKAYQKPSGKY